MEFRNAGLSAGAAMKTTKNIMEGVRSMKEPTPLPLTDFILEKDNPAVEACMKRLLKNKSANREKTIDDDPRWRQKTQEFCFQNKISYSSMKPPVEFGNSPWFNALPHRKQDSIIVRVQLQREKWENQDGSPCATAGTLAQGKEVQHTPLTM